MSEIYIISAPIGIGKTTLIRDWILSDDSLSVGGFLTPVVNNKRQIYFPSTKKHIPFEVAEIAENQSFEILKIGRYEFYKSAFSAAITQLNKDLKQNAYDYLIIDELGKLEIESDSGFEPQFSQFLEEYHCYREPKPALVVVVRNTLLLKAIEKYNFQNVRINQGPFVRTFPDIQAVVVAGGKSSRMGESKAHINYHGMPQFQYVVNQLKTLNIPVAINANDFLETENPVFADDPEFLENGPMSGLLTAHKNFLEKSILFIGVDYPNLPTSALSDLLHVYLITGKTVCYKHPDTEFYEPLIALYEANQLTPEMGIQNNHSLNQFLRGLVKKYSAITLNITNPSHFKSFDTPDDKKHLNSL